MGIMAAINVLFVLLTTLVPFLLFLIVFVLPLTSAIVTIYCKKKYFIIYAISTIALCMIVTIWNIGDTIFYVIPSIISGFLFALLLEKRINPLYIIMITTIVQVVFSYLSIPLIKLITSLSIIETFANAFKITSFAYIDYLVPVAILLLSFIQQIISYAVIKEELEKFVKLEEAKYSKFLLQSISIIVLIAMVVLAYLMPEYSLCLLCIATILSTHQFVDLIVSKNYLVYILLGIGAIVVFFLFAAFYQQIKEPLGILLIGLYSFLVSIISLINNYLLKDNSKYRINV